MISHPRKFNPATRLRSFLALWQRALEERPLSSAVFPYLFGLRLLILVAATLYPLFRGGAARMSPLHMVGLTLMALTIVPAYFLAFRRRPVVSEWTHNALVLADVAAVTLLCAASADPKSDLYLLYCLPIVTATLRIGGRAGLATLGYVSCCYAMVVYDHLGRTSTFRISQHILTTVAAVAPRQVFFFL